MPVAPLYQGFHLANLWGESLDYANHQSSLNGFQAERDADGALRATSIAHRDPGVANWLDTTGLPVGFMTFRWTYARGAGGSCRRSRVEKVPLAEVRAPLRRRTTRARLGGASARRTIAIRQAHVQRRYRQY